MTNQFEVTLLETNLDSSGFLGLGNELPARTVLVVFHLYVDLLQDIADRIGFGPLFVGSEILP